MDQTQNPDSTSIFPQDFVLGVVTSTYRIECAWNEGSKGDVVCAHYHRRQEDMGLMALFNIPAHCFSISWPRILPSGIRR